MIILLKFVYCTVLLLRRAKGGKIKRLFYFIFLGAEYFPANTAPWFLGGLGLPSPP